jgi:hypothetical protein
MDEDDIGIARRPMSSACPVPTATTFTPMLVASVKRGNR